MKELRIINEQIVADLRSRVNQCGQPTWNEASLSFYPVGCIVEIHRYEDGRIFMTTKHGGTAISPVLVETMKPAIYPVRSLADAAARFPRCQMDLSTPRNASERWSCEVLKDRKLLAGAVHYKPADARQWTERLRTAIRMAEVEAAWYPMAGYRK